MELNQKELLNFLESWFPKPWPGVDFQSQSLYLTPVFVQVDFEAQGDCELFFVAFKSAL